MIGIEDYDFSAQLQKDQISEELPTFGHPFPSHSSHLQVGSMLTEYNDQIELEDSPYHSYKVEDKLLMIDLDEGHEIQNSLSEVFLIPPHESTQN